MKKILLFALMLFFAIPLFAARFSTIDGKIDVSASIIQMSKTTLKAKNKIDIKMISSEGYNYKIKCSELKVAFNDLSKETSWENVNEFICSGGVNIEIDAVDDSTVISHSEEAYYDKSREVLILIGDVKIDYLSKNGQNISAVGKKATIDLRKELKNDEVLFAIEGDGEIKPVITVPQTIEK